MLNFVTKNSLFKNTGIYTFTSIIDKAIPFLMLPILTRYMSPEDYGIVSMFSLLTTITIPFVGVGVHGAITRQYYNQEEIDIWQYVGNCLFILIISTLITGLIFFIFSGLISSVASFPIKVLWIVVAYSFCQFINTIILSLFQVHKKASLYGSFNILKTLTNFIFSIIFVVGMGLTWKGQIYGQFISVMIFAILAIVYMVKNNWIKFIINKDYILSALIFGIPLIPHALSGSIISMTDRLFITNMVGLSETGVYSVGYQVGSIISVLTVSFNNAYVPWLYEKLKKDEIDTKIKIVKFTYLYFVIIVLIAIFLGLISPCVLQFFLGKSFVDSSIYVIWVSIGYAFNGMYLMVVNYIFYAQKTKSLAIVTFATAILNLILNYFFISEFGAIGAAQATTITFLIKFLFVWFLSNKVLKMPWNLLKYKTNNLGGMQ